MRFVARWLVLGLMFLLTSTSATGQVPRLLDYQGRLANQDGMPVADAAYTLTFRLYEVEIGGAPIWTEIQVDVTTKNGLFSTVLGKETLLD